MTTVISYPTSRTSLHQLAGFRWAAAILVAAVTLGMFANYLMTPGPGEPIRLPAAFLSNQDGTECPNTEQSLDRLSLGGDPAMESAIDIGPGPYEGRPGVRSEALPSGGEDPDPEAVAGITSTLQVLTACVNEQNSAGTIAFTSDDYWRRLNSLGIDVNSNSPRSLVPMVGLGEDETSMPEVEDPRLLEDGRIGAVIRPGFDAPTWMYNYYVFVNVDGQWLIDEAVYVNEWESIEVTVTDDGFAPSEIIVTAAPSELVLRNEGTTTHSLLSLDLGIRIEVEPGEEGRATIKRPAGTYEFGSDVPGDDASVFSGTLTIEGEPAATPVPSPVAEEQAISTVPVASLTVEMNPPEGFTPNEIYILAGRDVEMTLVNTALLDEDISGVTPVANGIDGNLTIEEIGVSVEVAAGETQVITINAEPGTYVITSDIPGHSQVGMTGLLHVVEEATPAP